MTDYTVQFHRVKLVKKKPCMVDKEQYVQTMLLSQQRNCKFTLKFKPKIKQQILRENKLS